MKLSFSEEEINLIIKALERGWKVNNCVDCLELKERIESIVSCNRSSWSKLGIQLFTFFMGAFKELKKKKNSKQ